MKFDAQRLKAERVYKGITEAEMAEIIGMSESAYCRLEKRNRRMDIDVFAQIVTALGFEPHDLGIFFVK